MSYLPQKYKNLLKKYLGTYSVPLNLILFDTISYGEIPPLKRSKENV